MTPSEYEICCLLMKNPNRVFTKDEIYERIFGFDGIGDAETTIRERIKEIRKKFQDQICQEHFDFSDQKLHQVNQARARRHLHRKERF